MNQLSHFYLMERFVDERAKESHALATTFAPTAPGLQKALKPRPLEWVGRFPMRALERRKLAVVLRKLNDSVALAFPLWCSAGVLQVSHNQHSKNPGLHRNGP